MSGSAYRQQQRYKDIVAASPDKVQCDCGEWFAEAHGLRLHRAKAKAHRGERMERMIKILTEDEVRRVRAIENALAMCERIKVACDEKIIRLRADLVALTGVR